MTGDTVWNQRKMMLGVLYFVRLLMKMEKGTDYFFSEGNGLVNGWTLLEEALQDMGTKESRGEKRKSTNTNFHKKAEILKEDQIKNQPCPDTMSSGKNEDTIWLDMSDCILKRDLGLLKYGVAGKWKSQPATNTI